MNFVAKPTRPSINPDKPFERDCFGLEKFGAALGDLVQNTSASFVVNLEAPWGQGKTTFLEMWRHQLRANGTQSLYFNAWETDFSSDPLIALIGELSAEMESLNVSKSSSAGKQLAKLKKIGARVAIRSLPALVKAGTLGILDLSEVTEEMIAAATERIAEEELKRYEEARKSIDKFRHELEIFAAKLGKASEQTDPLVIIVDELDRCKPDYAIRVLETVKHLFSVRGVFFLVATDSKQLSNAIKHVYGLDAAADDYLRRFFDLSVSLPVPSAEQFVQAQIVRFGLEEFFDRRTHQELRYDKDQVVATFVAMFNTTDCSLRDQEKCFTLLAISMRSIGENTYLHPLLLCPLIVIRIKRRPIYEQFIGGEIGADDLIKNLSTKAAGRSFFASDRGYGDVVRAYLIGATVDRTKRDAVLKQLQVASGKEDDEKEGNRARRVLEIYSHHSFRNATNAIKHVLPRIEFFARPDVGEDF